MKQKGFTLIELLAVIVILAIIALIATPIILNIIEESKENAALRSAELYVDAVQQSIANKLLDDSTKNYNGEYEISNNGKNLTLKTDSTITLEPKYSGNGITEGSITITNGLVSNLVGAKIDGYELEMVDNKINIKGKSEESSDVVTPGDTDTPTETPENTATKYTVTYTDITNNGYPTEIEEGSTLTVDLTSEAPYSLIVKIDGTEITNYTYENNILTLTNVTGNVEIIDLSVLITFTVNDEEYQAYDGMTWRDFVESDFNPVTEEGNSVFVLSGGGVRVLKGICTQQVLSDATISITANEAYTSSGMNECSGGSN